MSVYSVLKEAEGAGGLQTEDVVDLWDGGSQKRTGGGQKLEVSH
jgi:hypothetical protein